MTALRELLSSTPFALTAAAIVIGFLFGALIHRTNFCTMGGVSDLVLLNDGRRLRAWFLSILIALIATQGLVAAGVVAIDKSMYLAPRLNWLGHLAGGGMLGFGMVFTGGCPSRNLARAGGGDLRSLMVLIITGLAAFVTIGGILGPARVALDRATTLDLAFTGMATQGVDALLQAGLHLAPRSATLLAIAAIAGALIAFCIADRAFRRAPVHIASGVGVGLLVAAGWAVTGLAFDDLAVNPVTPASLTFVRPAGDTLEWLQRATALGWPGFGVGSVLGALVGAWCAATAAGRFRVEAFTSKTETVRAMWGAMLMGIGGVMALGCTVGQGVTGASTLAIGAYLTLAAIIAGCMLGLRMLERWS